MKDAKEVIQILQMDPHPEGGYYKETYKSEHQVERTNGAKRNVCTAIYYLLENEDKSHFHRIRSDELWFFHQGQPLEIFSIENDQLIIITLGNDLGNGELPQASIPANTWFAARIKTGSHYSLVSCSVAPGFDFEDFELARREDLILQYPNLKEVIEKFTRSTALNSG